MSDQLRVWTCYFTRSEYGPLEPFIEVALEEKVELCAVDMCHNSIYRESDEAVTSSIRSFDPHVVLCPFDRPEMARVAHLAYHLKYPVAQTYAGDIAGGAFDDADRFAISNYATYLFCSDTPQLLRMLEVMRYRQLIGWHTVIERSGPTAFDDMRYELPGDEDYSLVLYNPPSLATDTEIKMELYELTELLENEEKVYWVEPNGDPRSNMVREYAQSYNYLPNMDRQEFLGWLAKCNTFYGNSSAGFYEAPYFGVNFVQVGMRNRFRERISISRLHSGASLQIIRTLKRELL